MLKTFSITDIGRKRKVNQDYIYTSEKPVGNLPNVFIVADGMGGHNAGDYASKVTVETMLAEMENSFEKNPTLIFRKAIEEANAVIRKTGIVLYENGNVGTVQHVDMAAYAAQA